MNRTVDAQLIGEAERRARAGESFVAISEDLGVPTSTLSDWARQGGWRRKDCKADRIAELADLAAEAAALEPDPYSLDDGRPSPEFLAMAMAQMLMQRGQFDEAGKALRLAVRFVDFRERTETRLFRG